MRSIAIRTAPKGGYAALARAKSCVAMRSSISINSLSRRSVLLTPAALPTPRAFPSTSKTSSQTPLIEVQGRQRKTTTTAASAASPSSGDQASTSSPSSLSPSARAADTVTRFYSAWNAADPDGATLDMASDVEYWDTIYEKPFVGKENVREYFAKAARVLGPAVKFVVDGLSPAEDGSAVGVKWHCELDDGTPLPNSRGCSFYELGDSGRVIVRARDFVEPSVKPGAATLYLLRAVLPLVRLSAKFEKKDEGDGGGGKGGSGGAGGGGGSEGGPPWSTTTSSSSSRDGGGGGDSLAFDNVLSASSLASSADSGSFARGSVSGAGEAAAANKGPSSLNSLAFAFGGGDGSSSSSSSFLASDASDGGIASFSPHSKKLSFTSLSFFGGGKESSSGGGGGGGRASSASSSNVSPPSPPPPSKPPGSLTVNSALVWFFYVAYFSFVFFSRELPGLPVLETPPEVLTEVIHESWTFYYFVPVFNLIADAVALPQNLRIPDLPEHPTSEALFNFVNAWSMMMLPVMLSEASAALPSGSGSGGGGGGEEVDDDAKKSSSSNAFKWWLGVQFLTNVFMIPYMALRAREGGAGNDLVPLAWKNRKEEEGEARRGADGDGEEQQGASSSFPRWTPAIGLAGASIGVLSILWALFARPEVAAELGRGLGDGTPGGGASLEGRWAWAAAALSSNRATWAFALDASLYSVWQAAMLRDARALERFVPFFGMSSYLMRGGGGGGGEKEREA